MFTVGFGAIHLNKRGFYLNAKINNTLNRKQVFKKSLECCVLINLVFWNGLGFIWYQIENREVEKEKGERGCSILQT